MFISVIISPASGQFSTEILLPASGQISTEMILPASGQFLGEGGDDDAGTAVSVPVSLAVVPNEMQAEAERQMVAAPAGDLTSDCADGGTFNETQAVAKRQRVAAPAGDLLSDCADDGDVEAEAAVLVHESLAASPGGGEIKDRGNESGGDDEDLSRQEPLGDAAAYSETLGVADTTVNDEPADDVDGSEPVEEAVVTDSMTPLDHEVDSGNSSTLPAWPNGRAPPLGVTGVQLGGVLPSSVGGGACMASNSSSGGGHGVGENSKSLSGPRRRYGGTSGDSINAPVITKAEADATDARFLCPTMPIGVDGTHRVDDERQQDRTQKGSGPSEPRVRGT